MHVDYKFPLMRYMVVLLKAHESIITTTHDWVTHWNSFLFDQAKKYLKTQETKHLKIECFARKTIFDFQLSCLDDDETF